MPIANSTLHNVRPNPAWASLPLFNRTGWTRMAFGEFALSVNERAEPKDAQEEIYVGLEHLDPQCLHIRRWGKGSDVTGSKLRFRKGDLIFGRRRAYQRKLAVAEFDGICSAHAMVVRAKEDKVLPEFLPFLMMSDRFMNRAVEISVGSLSPTINWTTLKLEEFALPPLDQQRRIAEILWAVDEVDQALESTYRDCEGAITAYREAIAQSGAPVQRIEEITTLVTKGESPGWQGFEYQDNGPLFVTSENVLFGRYSPEPKKHIPEAFHQKVRRSAMQRGDLLFNLVGASIGRGCVLPELGSEANTNQAVAVIRLDTNKALPEYVLGYMLSPSGLKKILGTSVNSARANLSLEGIRNTSVPIEGLEVQKERISQIEGTQRFSELVDVQRERLSDVRNSILNQITTP